jgi:hypothetical protein
MSDPAVSILLVEDNPDHAELTLRALKRGKLLNRIFWVKDGAEALDFLYRRRHLPVHLATHPPRGRSISKSLTLQRKLPIIC